MKPLFHPVLGLGWQGEVTEQETAGLTHRWERESKWVIDESEWETDEEIIGKGDSRSPVRNTEKTPFRWVCHLKLIFRGPAVPGGVGKFVGAGVLISPRHVLTAAHNLVSDMFGAKPTDVAELIVTPGKDRSLAPFGATEAAANGLFVPDKWRNSFDEGSDYGVIKLKDNIGAMKQKKLRNKPLGFWGSVEEGDGTRFPTVAVPAELKGKKMMLAGYPTDKCGYDAMLKWKRGEGCKMVRPEDVDALPAKMKQCIKDGLHASAMFGAEGRIIDPAAGPLLLHDADTCKGHSGSPIWMHSGKERNLVAIHTGTRDDKSNRAIRISREVKDQIVAWMRL